MLGIVSVSFEQPKKKTFFLFQKDLPAVVVEDQGASPMPSLAEDEEEEGESSSTTESKEMTIAWRYRDKPLVQVSF